MSARESFLCAVVMAIWVGLNLTPQDETAPAPTSPAVTVEPAPKPKPVTTYTGTGNTKGSWEAETEPAVKLVEKESAKPTPAGVQWREGYFAARAEAKETGRDLLVVFTNEKTCAPCRVLAKTFEDPEVAEYVNEHFVPVKCERDTPGLGLKSLPSLWGYWPGKRNGLVIGSFDGVRAPGVKTDKAGLLGQLKQLRGER